MIVLDTDVLIEILDKRSEKGDETLRIVLESGDSISTTAVNLHELMYGLQKYAKPLGEVLQLPVLNYTKEDARLSARLEVGAEKTGLLSFCTILYSAWSLNDSINQSICEPALFLNLSPWILASGSISLF